MKAQLKAILAESLARARERGRLTAAEARIEVEKPRDSGHGDLATNLALTLAKGERKPPREVAAAILENLVDPAGLIAKAEVAGPGFINFFFSDALWQRVADEVATLGLAYGQSDLGQGRRVQVEFVSANPTGPLHVGHGRGAALGDAIARLLAATGHRVVREFYINDAGRQMLMLGLSVHARMRESLGLPVS